MNLLNNTATQDTYAAALTVPAPRAAHLSLSIRNAAVYFELGRGWPAEWLGETYKPPGDLERDIRFDAIRIRSATPGVPARVTVFAQTPEEL